MQDRKTYFYSLVRLDSHKMCIRDRLRVVCNEETVVREKTPKTQPRKSYFVIDAPQLVVDKEIETKKSEKGLLNKIAVKKQDGGESGEAEKKNAEHKGCLLYTSRCV